ncbi:hypothetical protein [Burkholderia dolosa]|uniref:hypothetical protein n=1 Tax=Burkholderia dolosa TaxID=152500 RepID=UPI0020110A78|nr:hypothetical protein [Burkholderia dolosa]
MITDTRKKPAALLRIFGPLILEQEPLYALMASFPNDYPPVQVDLYFTNAFLDPIAENVDVAIRFGELAGFQSRRAADRNGPLWNPMRRRARRSYGVAVHRFAPGR